MSGDRDPLAGILRWYPSAWRDRYGTELVALMEDELGGRRPTTAFRASMATSGVRQRVRSAGLAGDGGMPEVRMRAGALVVLVSWAALVIGGAAFAKASEHYDTVGPIPGHRAAQVAYDVAGVAAIVGTLLVLAGTAVALPATLRFFRAGGWSSVRRSILTSVVLTGLAAAALVGIGVWAHHLDFHQRNGGDTAYGIAFGGCALLAAASLGAWAWAGIGVARRIELDPEALRIEVALSVGVAAVVVTIAAAVGVWWAGMAHGAAWYLAGTRPGSHPSPLTAQLMAIEGWLVVATVVALFGVTRAVRSSGTA